MYSEGRTPSKQWRNKPPIVNGCARVESIPEVIVKNNGLTVQFQLTILATHSDLYYHRSNIILFENHDFQKVRRFLC